MVECEFVDTKKKTTKKLNKLCAFNWNPIKFDKLFSFRSIIYVIIKACQTSTNYGNTKKYTHFSVVNDLK